MKIKISTSSIPSTSISGNWLIENFLISYNKMLLPRYEFKYDFFGSELSRISITSKELWTRFYRRCS